MPNQNNSLSRALPDSLHDRERLAHGIEGAANRLGVGRTTIFELIRSGRLKAVKLNGRTLIPEAALREFLVSLPSVTA